VPVDNVVAIYARENGQGMAFEVSPLPASNDKESGALAADNAFEKSTAAPALIAVPSLQAEQADGTAEVDKKDDPDPPKKGGRPTLTRIK